MPHQRSASTGGSAAVVAGYSPAVTLKLTLRYLCCYIYMEPDPDSLEQVLPVGFLLGSASIPYLQGLVASGSSAAKGMCSLKGCPGVWITVFHRCIFLNVLKGICRTDNKAMLQLLWIVPGSFFLPLSHAEWPEVH